MNVLNQIGLGKLAGAAPEIEDERVLMLFRNRSELKKAYKELQDEIYRLKERLRQQEGSTRRVQEMMAGLESRLEVRKDAYSTLVFYQLRRLWRVGYELLSAYAADLEKQQIERERRAFLVESNRLQFNRRQQSEAALSAAQEAALAARRAMQDCEKKMAGLRYLWNRFRRRNLQQQMPQLAAALATSELALAAARETHEGLLAEAEQGFPGLSVEARRAVNISLIAYVEILCARLANSPLLPLARDATTRRDLSEGYGSYAECEALMTEIEVAQVALRQAEQLPQDIKRRSEQLRRVSRYLKPEDTIPTIDSLASADGDMLVDLGNASAKGLHTPNVLAEDSWDIFRILIR